MANLRNLNLNVLLSFDALMKAKHLTRAASDIGLSQPGMSYSLKQLRRIFKDELFVKTVDGMLPTEMAKVIYTDLKPILESLSSLIDRSDSFHFDPKDSGFNYKVGLSDYTAAVYLPILERLLFENSPNASIEVIPISECRQHSIASQVDFLIHTFDQKPKQELTQVLYDEEIVLVYDPSHLGFNKRITLKAFCDCRHLLINFREAPPVSITNSLSAKGLTRKIAVSTPYSFSAGEIVKGSKLICALPKKVAEIFSVRYQLEYTMLPIKLPTYPVCLQTNTLSATSPEVQWLTGLLFK